MSTALATQSNALAVQQTALVVGGAPAPTPAEWDMFQSMAAWVFRSRMFSQYSSPEQCMVAMMIGRDLGIAPTAALAKGFVIEDGGKFKFDVEVQVKLAVVQARLPNFSYEIVKWDETECTLRGGMKGGQQVIITITIEEAKRRRWALDKYDNVKKTYQNNPKDMLMWRAQARLLKLTAGGALYGAVPAMIVDTILEEGDESGAVVIEDEKPAGNGLPVGGAAPPPGNAAPQASKPPSEGHTPPAEERRWQDWKKDFIQRAKVSGWRADAKIRDLINNLLRENGLREINKAVEVAPFDWPNLFAWLDARYDAEGHKRPKVAAGVTSSTPVAAADGVAVPASVAPTPALEVPPSSGSDPQDAEAAGPTRLDVRTLALELAKMHTKAGRERPFVIENPPGSARWWFADIEILTGVGLQPVSILLDCADTDAPAVPHLCSEALLPELIIHLHAAQRAMGR